MNIKSISGKLDFLENLIVEMNPENLEGLKTLSLEKISEIIRDINVFERAVYVSKHTGLDIENSINIAESESSIFVETGIEVDVSKFLTVSSKWIGRSFSDLIFALPEDFPKIGDELKLEFENPKVIYDKPASKYFTKPKNNFKKR